MIPNQHKKSIEKMMRQAAGRHSLYDIFRDFCELSAISLRNAVEFNKQEFDKRETAYLSVIKKYTPQEIELFPQMLGLLVLSLEEEPRDYLGELFGEMEIHNKWVGQFFTPYHVCRLMAAIQVEGVKAIIEEKGFVTVNEPACGAGAMIIAFADEMKRAGLNYQQQVHVTAQDIDIRSVHMAYIQLSLLHIPALVILGNTLTVEVREVWPTPAHVLGMWDYKLRRGHLIEKESPMQEITEEMLQEKCDIPSAKKSDIELTQENFPGMEKI
jgi:hypothetical protein